MVVVFASYRATELKVRGNSRVSKSNNISKGEANPRPDVRSHVGNSRNYLYVATFYKKVSIYKPPHCIILIVRLYEN